MSHPELDALTAGERIADLHRKITGEKLRVELTLAGSDQRCVLLSKDELDDLERALDLLSRSDAYRAMAAELTDIAETARAATC